MILLLMLLALSRDAITYGERNRIHLFHVRPAAVVEAKCGLGVTGCIGQRRLAVTEVWLVDDAAVALYLCARILGTSKADAADLPTLLQPLQGQPAPTPICLVDRYHQSASVAGHMMTVEQWQQDGIVPAGTGTGILQGSITDVNLNPLVGKLEIRDMQNEFVADARADGNGEFWVRLKVGAYYLRLNLDDGRTQEPLVLAIGEDGWTVPWIVGLTE